VQITGKAGDVIFCHYHRPRHRAQYLTNIRYGLFFRVKHHAHDSHSKETLSNLWMDCPESKRSINKDEGARIKDESGTFRPFG
jgi:hypothetical protein